MMSHYFLSLHPIHKSLTTAYNSVTRNFLYRCLINKNLTFCGTISQIISPHALIHNVMKHLTLKYLKQETLKYGIISGFSLTSSG